MTNLKTVIADIKETVAPLMEKWVEDRVTFIMNLQEYMKNLRNNPEYRESWYGKNNHYYEWLEYKGYNQGDIQLARCSNKVGIEEKMQKLASEKLQKIDVAVAKKINFDVQSVERLFLKEGKDGFFEGAWRINGEKTFSFDTFYAGGYNIQCHHVRTKYKLK